MSSGKSELHSPKWNIFKFRVNNRQGSLITFILISPKHLPNSYNTPTPSEDFSHHRHE